VLHGPGNSVGIATGYGLDGPGIESRWGRDFSHTSRRALGRGADYPPPSSAEVKKGYSYTSLHPLGQLRPVTGVLLLGSPYVYISRLRVKCVRFKCGS
jgi:hypothetical protein